MHNTFKHYNITNNMTFYNNITNNITITFEIYITDKIL